MLLNKEFGWLDTTQRISLGGSLDDEEVAALTMQESIILDHIIWVIMNVGELRSTLLRISIFQLVRLCLNEVKGRRRMEFKLALEGAVVFAVWFADDEVPLLSYPELIDLDLGLGPSVLRSRLALRQRKTTIPVDVVSL